jgi:hypothetical protein
MEAAPGESSCRKISKSLVRWGEVENEKSASSKIMCRETMMLLVVRSKTPVTFVVSGVSDENTSSGLRCQFVGGFGGEIRIAGTTEHVQVLIGGGDVMESEVWASHADRLGGEAVQQICGGVEPFYPIASGNRILKKKGAQYIINDAEDVFGFTILQRSIWTRHPLKYPFGGEECVRGGVIKLTAIVTLDGFDGAAKLCGDIRKKFDKVEKSLGFNT